MNNRHKHNIHNINKSRVSLLNRLKCDCLGIAQGKISYGLRITELIITNIFDRVLKVR
jgi:hypothetical protein